MLVLFVVSSVFILNLGKFLDITQKPITSDILVFLAGAADNYRIEKTIKLYHEGYSETGTLLLTNSSKIIIKLPDGSVCKNKIKYLKRAGLDDSNIIMLPNVYNTVQELFALKQYMLLHKMKSVLLVSDAVHSRRISFLAKKVVGFSSSGLRLCLIGSDSPWWNRNAWYQNKTSTHVALLEAVKIPYNFVKYNIVYKVLAIFGILEPAKHFFAPLQEKAKKYFEKTLYSFDNRL